MNIPILIAAIMSFISIFLHVFGGGVEIMIPIYESELSDYLRAIMFVIWHGITVIISINSVALFYVAFKSEYRKPLVIIIVAQYLLWSGLFIFYGITRLGELWTMPQWISFISISLLAIYGLKQGKKLKK